jgi:Methyltransferase domain
MAKTIKQKNQVITKPVKIDIGCGPSKIGPDWIGIDQYKMKGVDIVINIGKDKYPFKDNSVDEVHCSHTLEHLTNFEGKWERTHLFNELYRIMKKGAKATFIFPHWASNRYYGDPTHKEPFSEMGFYYLSKEWRQSQAPHADKKWNKHGYDCDFECAWGYNLRQDLVTRNQEYQQNAISNYKEVINDIVATVIKK